MGRRAHKPDPAQRKQVEAMAAYGIPELNIAAVLGVDPKTLRKHYRDELDLGETKANAQVAGFLFNAARNGNVTAQIFWLKTRARWRETPTELRHSGSIGRKELDEYSDEELIAIIQTELSLVQTKTITAEAGDPAALPALASATPRLAFPAR
jgi:hypothetical protein